MCRTIQIYCAKALPIINHDDADGAGDDRKKKVNGSLVFTFNKLRKCMLNKLHFLQSILNSEPHKIDPTHDKASVVNIIDSYLKQHDPPKFSKTFAVSRKPNERRNDELFQ